MMITLFPISVKEQISIFLQRDDLYKTLCNDEHLNKSAIDTTMHTWFSIIQNKEEVIGLLVLTPSIGNTMYFHFGLFKKYQNKNTNQIVQECIDQIKDKLPGTVLLFPIAEKNIAAIKASKKFGLQLKTTIINGYTNDNMLIYAES